MLIQLGVKPERIFTANEYPAQIYHDVEQIPFALPCPLHKYVLFIGRIIPLKGLEYVIDAFASPSLSHSNIHLLIVGDALDERYRQSLVGLVERKNLKNVHFMPGIYEDKRKSFLLNNALCGIIASCHDSSGTRDAGPLVALETLSAGTPLIMTDIIGNAWHIKNGVNGYVIPEKNVNKICKAILKCTEGRIASRQEIFNDFHSIPGREKQCFELKNLIEFVCPNHSN